MSIEDRIAKALLTKHAGFLKSAKSDGWFTEIESQLEAPEQLEYKRAQIMIGETKLECLIAADEQAQIQGLQGHASLGPYEAMIFPYQEPRRVAFHMADVAFPIDMIFVGDDSRVTRIVENIEPGTPGHWGMPHVVAVVEVNGGFCQAHNIEVGAEVGQIESAPKTAQEVYTPAPRKDINPQMVTPNVTHDRFKDRDLVDKQVQDQPMDPENFKQEIGYDPANTEEQNDGIGPNVRPL